MTWPPAARCHRRSDIFDHTSVLKLLEEKWDLPALTRRDAARLISSIRVCRD